MARKIGAKRSRLTRQHHLIVAAVLFQTFYSLFTNSKNLLNLSFGTESTEEENGGIASILRRLDTKKEETEPALFSDQPFLVVCDNVDIPLLPIFSNFTVVRLNKNETPPPWNATAFLLAKPCPKHPYVVEAIERYKRSPYLVAPDLSPNITSHVYHGVRWPNFSINATKYLRVIHERPAIINVLGEVFWRMYYKDGEKNADFLIYREVQTDVAYPLTIHFLQGVAAFGGRKIENLTPKDVTDIYRKRIAHPYKPKDKELKYEKFCSFIIQAKNNSSQPVAMFNHSWYDVDAIVRHMFFLELSKYKECDRVTVCPGPPEVSHKCMVGYKFHITMENTLVNGYVSEKLFNGALGGGIPIYFGASDVGQYVNPKSFIHCHINKQTIEEMRSFYPRKQHPRPFTFKNSSSWVTDEELFLWAGKYLNPQLQPCIHRVIQLDKDDDAYKAVLNEPFIVRDDIMNGMYQLKGVALAYNILKRSVGNGTDFVSIPL